MNDLHNKPMTAEQEEHLSDLKFRIVRMLDLKYRAGAAEHGGNVWDKTAMGLLEESLSENIDQFTYLSTLKDEMDQRNETTVLVKKLNGSELCGVHTPKKAGDVGFDIEVSEDTVVPARGGLSGLATTIPCNAAISMPRGVWCQILGRSSAANKKGLVVNTACIDQGYVGPLFASCWNVTERDIVVKKGDRVAQVVFFNSLLPKLDEVDALPETQRGSSGFGSSGA